MIVIEEEKYIEINGKDYSIVENELGKIVRVEEVAGEGKVYEVEKDIFEIEGRRYYIDVANKQVRRVLNINKGKVCFEEGIECEIELEKIEAYDKEDEEEREVGLARVEHLADGNKYEPTSVLKLMNLDSSRSLLRPYWAC